MVKSKYHCKQWWASTLKRENMFNERIGLAVQGGGTRGVFAAGILDVLQEQGISFPAVYGTSAGSLCLANFLSGDLGRSRYIICTLMGDPRFVSVRNRIFRGTVFDFDYLFYEIPKSESPFDFAAFNDNKTRFGIVTTSLEDGGMKVFYKGETPDPFKALAASSSLPLLSRPVYVEGDPYLDGGPACSVPFAPGFSDGYEKMVVIATRPLGFRKKGIKRLSARLAKSMYKQYPAFIKTYLHSPHIYNESMDELDRLEKEGKVFRLCPETASKVGVAEKDEKKLEALYAQGREVALKRLADLKGFLS